MLLIIDNYDSFTYNLKQYFAILGQDVIVKRNDEVDIQAISKLAPDYLVISPGPKSPNDAGISMQAIEYFSDKVPILGVCLGQQAIAQVFGGKVVRAKQVMHGKNSLVSHNNSSVFTGLANPLDVTRYHSLVVDPDSLPSELIITAWTTDAQQQQEEIMGLMHRTLPIHSVQFHPEAILSQQGQQLLANFLHT